VQNRVGHTGNKDFKSWRLDIIRGRHAVKLFHVSASTDCLVFAESAEAAIEMVRRDENKGGQTVTYRYGGICIAEEFDNYFTTVRVRMGMTPRYNPW
jgi:hypothetical protein